MSAGLQNMIKMVQEIPYLSTDIYYADTSETATSEETWQIALMSLYF